MLNMLRPFMDLIVADIKQSFGIELLDDDVKLENLPSVLQSVTRYVVPYELKHLKSGYSGGQLEVLKQDRKKTKDEEKSNSRGQVRRFKDPSDGKGSVHITKEVEQILLPLIQTSERPTESRRLQIQNVQFCLSKMFGPNWNKPEKSFIFQGAPYFDKSAAIPYVRQTKVTLDAARTLDVKKLSEKTVAECLQVIEARFDNQIRQQQQRQHV
ncbi:hypothetical protein FB446DRAFT_713596 [Lentinula raphanica]|nr:hypothetical protein FB446DRAFT_713596 [Lentinula raphanica]